MDQNPDHHQLQPSTADTTPQDVLAEARKNLQVLIDSGLSKEVLHQWVEESRSQHLAFPAPSTIVPSQSSPIASHHQQQQHQLQPPPPPSHLPPPPPFNAPQCPPPPPPPSRQSAMPHDQDSSTSSPTTTTNTNTSAATTPSNSSIPIVKTESPNFDDIAQAWSSAQAASGMTLGNVPEGDLANYMSVAAIPSHRQRISVSSTSSGSSGHASIWSTNSARSSMSWHSTSSGHGSQAPLPMLPQNATTTNANGSQIPATATTTGRHNIYWCTSCETSFKRKYDWKRHEDEFHERWRKYPCPEPGCNRSFWGSNSFNQHHKQCHGCKTCPHAEKVVKFLRKRKYWACGFCSALHPARERHVEHVARHFESGLTKNDWMHSKVVYGLLHQPLIHEAWESLVTSKHSEYSGRRPQFSWHPSKTGRAQGFLEKENTGQLQDLLEFFSGDDAEAQSIVSLAHELADVVLNAAPSQASQYSQSSMESGQFSPAESRVSMSSMSLAAPQPQLLPSPDPNHQNLFGPTMRSSLFASPPSFPMTPKLSPHSASQPPVVPSQSILDKRDLPPPPSVPENSMMDFEYSPSPAVFNGWPNLTNHMMDGETHPHSESTTTQPDWGMVQYFNDPRVTS